MNDKNLIPKGMYCYVPKKLRHDFSLEIYCCPFWHSLFDEESWEEIYYCSYLNFFDKKHDLSLLWDQTKLCGINDKYESDYNE